MLVGRMRTLLWSLPALLACSSGAARASASVDAGDDAPSLLGDGAAPPDTGAPPPWDGGPLACGDAAVSLASDLLPIFDRRCAGVEGCHGAAVSTAPAVFAFLVNAPSTECPDRMKVTPGDPERSYVIDKLLGRNLCGSGNARMPLGGAPLAPAEIQRIYDWICQGAPND